MKIFTNQDPSRTLGSNANNTWYTLNAIIINLELRQSITMLSLQLANSAGCCMKSLNLPQSQTNLRTVSQSHSSSLGQFRHRRYDWIIHRSVRQNIKRTCIMGPLLWMTVSFFESLNNLMFILPRHPSCQSSEQRQSPCFCLIPSPRGGKCLQHRHTSQTKGAGPEMERVWRAVTF